MSCFNMWPFKKKTDREVTENDLSLMRFLAENEKLAIAATKRELLERERKLAEYESSVRMCKTILKQLDVLDNFPAQGAD